MAVAYSILLALLTGALLGVAFPAIGDLPIFAFVALVPLLAVEDRFDRNRKRGTGWILPYAFLSFLSYNFITTWWIYYASPGGMIMAVLANGLLMALVFLCFHYTKRVLGPQRGYIGLFFYWIGFEWLHLNWELSWPWLNLGNIFATRVDWVQWYEYTGVLGGTLWILVVNVLVFRFIRHLFITPRSKRKLFVDVPLLLFFGFVPYFWSGSILSDLKEKEKGEKVEVALIQPNIDPYTEKFPNGKNFISYDGQFQRIMKWARKAARKTDPDLFIAPETSLLPASSLPSYSPYFLLERLDSYQRIESMRSFLRKEGSARFLIGLSMKEHFDTSKAPSSSARSLQDTSGFIELYNSALQVPPKGKIGIHHKTRLVLGVEKIPFSGWLPFLEDFAIELGGSSGSLGTQEGPSVFGPTKPSQDPSRVVPLICYESVYGGFVADAVREKGANVLAVITNDGWWSKTPGYKQHLAFARLRAVETRKAVARSANTGISAIIDRTGDIKARTSWWEQDVLTGTIRRNKGFTFYALQGDGIGRLFGFLALLLLPYTVVRQVKQRSERH
ncbi:MAG: apolipoprotein N-acyltransferase [Flavobacteriales bacterium]